MFFRVAWRIVVLTIVIACIIGILMGPFQVLINTASSFGAFGAILLAVVTALGGGWLVWRLCTSIITQTMKGLEQ